MVNALGLVLAILRDLVASRHRLILENAALRQQVMVLRRRAPRRHFRRGEKAFWMVLPKVLPSWRQVLFVTSPQTVLRWHRAGFRALWRHKCRHRIGRPEIPRKLYCLIRKLNHENPIWGAHRIADELALLGWKVGKSTVGRYMGRCTTPHSGQTWKTFIRNHMNVTAACDFFVVPTIGLKRLFAFVVLEHDRRRIRHVAVTARPSVEWTARQLALAYPEDVPRPKYLVHDREKTFRCPGFLQQLEALGIEDRKTAPRQPWMNSYCERVIGTLRRECTDHLLALDAEHLERLLREYVEYYNASRTHMALERNAPEPRGRASEPAEELVGTPVLGGLHHVYERAAYARELAGRVTERVRLHVGLNTTRAR